MPNKVEKTMDNMQLQEPITWGVGKTKNVKFLPILWGIDTLEVECKGAIDFEIKGKILEVIEKKQIHQHIEIAGTLFAASRVKNSPKLCVLKANDIEIQLCLGDEDEIPDAAFLSTNLYFLQSKLSNGLTSDTAITAILDILFVASGWYAKVKRADFFVDILSKQRFKSADQKRISSKASYIGQHQTNGEFSGFTIGKSPRRMNIYDKLLEVQLANRSRLMKLWSKNIEPDQTVWRVELQLRYAHLKQLGVHCLSNLFSQAPEIWRKTTDNWCTMRKAKNSRNKTPEITPFWAAIQDASDLFDKLPDVPCPPQEMPNLENLLCSMRGSLSLVAVFNGTNRLQNVVEWVVKELEKNPNHVEFWEAMIREKQLKYGLTSKPN